MLILFAALAARAESPGVPPALEHPPEVQLTPEGDLYARGPDGALSRLPHAALVAVEAHCDATTCDLVFRTADRRVAIGAHPRAAAAPGPILGLPVELTEVRLEGAPLPRRTGELTADVKLRPSSAPTAEPPLASALAALVPSPVLRPSPVLPPSPPTAPGGAVPPVVLGVLEKPVIEEVIRSNMAEIRYCYRRALATEPTLAGRVTVKFVIAADGTVASATVKSTTLAAPAVESCICGRFMRFVFPPPKGDGIVIVSYPFAFSP
jgi:hypothetical protein